MSEVGGYEYGRVRDKWMGNQFFCLDASFLSVTLVKEGCLCVVGMMNRLTTVGSSR